MTSDSLSELLTHLERYGDVPLAWVVANAPDGDLRRLWASCAMPATLIRLSAHLAPDQTFVALARDCGVYALARLPEGQSVLGPKLAVVEAWLRRSISLAELESAHATPLPPLQWPNVSAPVSYTLAAALIAERDPATIGIVEEAIHAVEKFGFIVEVGAQDRTPRETFNAIMGFTLTHLPCPALDQLREAFRDG